MKKFLFILLIALSLICFNGCRSCSSSQNDPAWAEIYEDSDGEEGLFDETNEEIYGNALDEPIEVNVPANVTLEQAARSVYADLASLDVYNIGGTKLCAEMSADRAGFNKSFYPEDKVVTFLPPKAAGLLLLNLHNDEPDNSDVDVPNVVRRIINREVEVKLAPIESNPDWDPEPDFIVPATITNISPDTLVVDIPVGTMLETQKNDAQNIVVNNAVNFTLPPNYYINVKLKARCAAHQRGNPVGSSVKLTPFILDVPSSAYRNQNALWEAIEQPITDDKEYTLTFYAWHAGAALGDHGYSQYGHAFVHIHGIGTVGFGQNGITRHEYSESYATLTMSIKINEENLQNVYQKYQEWVDYPREYQAARHDCTSFVMDMADAANIHYGTRWLIQFPEHFMMGLRFYNKK